jgi:hypothetical protein
MTSSSNPQEQRTAIEGRALLESKLDAWKHLATDGSPEYRDYNRRAHAALSALLQQRDDLVAALEVCRKAIVSDQNGLAIVCTVWVPDTPSETLVDFIDAALERARSTHTHGERDLMATETTSLAAREIAVLRDIDRDGFTGNRLFSDLRDRKLIKQLRPRQAGPWILTDAGRAVLAKGET